MNTYKINQDYPEKGTINVGDKVELTKQTQEVVKCIESGVLMLNIDADQLQPGDLTYIKKINLTISNPETDKPVALGVEYRTIGRTLSDWFESEDEEDDDDTPFFSPSSSGSIFRGSRSSGGFGGFGGGGFGGFGGGRFSGGGAARGF